MTGTDIRKLVIEMHHRAGTGHIGCSLSVADIIAAINPGGSDAPTFVLSKGHAASALYSALHINGHITKDELFTYCQPGSRLQVHPTSDIPCVPVSTGSLGMGLSIGCGIALSNPGGKVVVLVSDAELNEGSTWEAIMFAGHHALNNLWVFVDNNNQQAMGRAKDILDFRLWAPVNAFGWSCLSGDGHNTGAMTSWLGGERKAGWSDELNKPQMYIADTVFGKDVHFMESDVSWHYRVMDEHDYVAAYADLSCVGRS